MQARYFYAQIDGAGIVHSILDTDRALTDPQMVPVDSFDPSLLGQMHVGNGVFEVVP